MNTLLRGDSHEDWTTFYGVGPHQVSRAYRRGIAQLRLMRAAAAAFRATVEAVQGK